MIGRRRPALHSAVGVSPSPMVMPRPRRGMIGGAEPKDKRKGLNGANALSLVGGALMDLDGTMGGGNFANAQATVDYNRQRQEEEADKRKRDQAMDQVLQGLTPEQRMAAQLNPDAFGKAYTEDIFATDDPVTYGTDLETIMMGGQPVVGRTASDGSFVPIEGASPYEKPTGPLSSLGKLAEDLRAGRISQAQYDAEMRGRSTRGTTTVNIGPMGQQDPLAGLGYGSAPKGEDAAIVRDRDGNPVVTPGPQQEQYSKAIRGVQETNASNSIVLDDIDRAIDAAGNWSAGSMAWTKDLPAVGGSTPAGELENLLTTIQANVGFDKLQTMREISPTGGALGQVTEKELAFLQAVFGSMRQDQRPENLRYNLERLREHVNGREARLQEALAADFPSLAQTAEFRSRTNQQREDLSRYRAPDGGRVTEEDIQATMRANNMTREQVLARLKGG